MRKMILAFVSILLTKGIFGQELSCSDFKEGAFYIEANLNGRIMRYDIIRYPDFQEEFYENMDPMKVGLKWMDDCSYVITLDHTQPNFSEKERLINEGGGIKVYLMEIIDNCYDFKSSFTMNSETYWFKGKICKDRI
ncbi:MAG: hypothetical protein DWP94_02405 [Flavobacterium sp.]|nr:MAG: hypothetical protein DWP94_02405 [Flavobacterium sp.]